MGTVNRELNVTLECQLSEVLILQHDGITEKCQQCGDPSQPVYEVQFVATVKVTKISESELRATVWRGCAICLEPLEVALRKALRLRDGRRREIPVWYKRIRQSEAPE